MKAWSHIKLNKKIFEEIIGLKLYVPGESCTFSVCRVFFSFDFCSLSGNEIFLIAKKIFAYLDIPKGQRKFKTLEHLLGNRKV